MQEEAPVEKEVMRERLVRLYMSDREAMPPSMAEVPAAGDSYEEEARAHILVEYTEGDLDRLVSIYTKQAQGQDEEQLLTDTLKIFNAEKRKIKT